MQNMNLYQLCLSGLMLLWLAAVVLVWVRFDKLKHGKYMLICTLLWPLILMDEWIKSSGMLMSLNFLIGMCQFVPALIAGLLALSVRKVTLEKRPSNGFLYYMPTLLIVAGQIPLLLMSASGKVEYLMTPPVGDFLANWPYLAPYLLSAFILLIFAVNSSESLGDYHHGLSDQVVDITWYQMDLLNKGFIGIMLIAFFSIAMIVMVTFAIVDSYHWQTLINMLQAAGLLFCILLLLEKKRYSPAPFTVEQLEQQTFSEDYLRQVLKQAETALIRHKAYKRIGLRIRQLADTAEVEPIALALATRTVLKRNFRAFIYHYRLEYAKKVLMRTDAKVSSVAKRLGFNSEKYLSNVFIKYIQMMGSDSKKPKSTP